MADERDEPTIEDAPKSQTDRLLALTDDLDLFHDADGMAYCDRAIDTARETLPLDGRSFRSLLTKRYFEASGRGVDDRAIQSALTTLRARAVHDGPEHSVHLRTAQIGGNIYIDLGDATFKAIEVAAAGWRIIDRSPARFRRSATQRALPIPASDGDPFRLGELINVGGNEELVLVIAWMTAALAGRSPFPILVLNGEQGSAKSTTTRMIKALTDPSDSPLRRLPAVEHDLLIAAQNEHVLAIDNLSGLPSRMSDAFCCLATGAAMARRTLYTDCEETIVRACRPVILNGIDHIAARPDLADRSIVLHPPAISDTERKTEAELERDFARLAPEIFAGLLNAVAEGLTNDGALRLDAPPRMADFAYFAAAAETAHSEAGVFMRAYEANRDALDAGCFEDTPVGPTLIDWLHLNTGADGSSRWSGAATGLLAALTEKRKNAGLPTTKAAGWPQGANALSDALSRIEPLLRKRGVTVERTRSGRKRVLSIVLHPQETENRSSSSSHAPPMLENVHNFKDLDVTTYVTQPTARDDPAPAGQNDRHKESVSFTRDLASCDDDDDHLADCSYGEVTWL